MPRQQCCHWALSTSEKTYPTENAKSIEDWQKVKRQILPGDMLCQCVIADVEEDDVKTHEGDKSPEDINHISRLAKGGPIPQRALRRRLDPHLHHGAGDGEGAERHETNDSGRPGEPDLWLQLVKHDGVDDTSETAARGGQTHARCYPRVEIGGENGDRGYEETTGSQTDHHGLRQHGLPVLGA